MSATIYHQRQSSSLAGKSLRCEIYDSLYLLLLCKEGEHRPRTQLVLTKVRSLTSHSPTTQKRKMLGEYLYILFVYLFVKVKNKNNDCLLFLNYVPNF